MKTNHATDCDLDEDCGCFRAPDKLHLEVHDLVVSRRVVELSLECPGCGVDLSAGEGTLRHFESCWTKYQHQQRRVNVVADDDEGGFGIDWGVHDSKITDGEFAAEWQCAKCAHVLVQHDVSEVDGD